MDAVHLGPGDVPHLDVAGRGVARTVNGPASRRPEMAPETAGSRRPGRNVLTWRDLPSPHVPGL